MRKMIAPLFFCCFVLAGYWVSVESWDGAVFVYLGEQRSPAAVRSVSDYAAISRKALTDAVHTQMLQSAKLVKQAGYMGLTLGHPLFKVAGGANEFACPAQGRVGLFDRVELTFVGTGISSAGQQPKMIIETDCNPGVTLGELETIWIPMQDIVTATAKDQEIQIYGDHPVAVRLEQIPGEWPPGWVLWNLRLFRSANPEEGVSIDSAKIRESNGKMFSFDWQ